MSNIFLLLTLRIETRFSLVNSGFLKSKTFFFRNGFFGFVKFLPFFVFFTMQRSLHLVTSIEYRGVFEEKKQQQCQPSGMLHFLKTSKVKV